MGTKLNENENEKKMKYETCSSGDIIYLFIVRYYCTYPTGWHHSVVGIFSHILLTHLKYCPEFIQKGMSGNGSSYNIAI